MKTINKVLLGLATASTILAPLVPKNLNINITMGLQSPAINNSSYATIKTKCDLAGKSTTNSGMQVCEYKCRAGDKITVYKTFRTNAAFCPSTVDEQVKQTNK
jgi:hypothetical protein